MDRVLVALAAAAVASAATPPGFQPQSTTDLIVDYNGLAAMDGVVVAKEAVQAEPILATAEKLAGTSFAVIMVDLDIPTSTPPATSTLLHWLQTGLTQAPAAATLNTTAGPAGGFLLAAGGNGSALAPYIGPSPPARVPLSHRYAQVLVDTTGAGAGAAAALAAAAASRQGFDALQVLTAAGLEGRVVAGNFFNVTNPGPAAAAGGAFSNSTGGGAGANGTGTRGGAGPTPATPFTAGAPGPGPGPQAGAVLWLLVVAGLILGL